MRPIIIKKCLGCNYEWIARVENPVQCPNCKTMKWEIKEMNTHKTAVTAEEVNKKGTNQEVSFQEEK